MVVTRTPGRRRQAALMLVLGALVLAACGGGGDDLTLEEQLAKLAGRPLSVAEIDDQLALADMMCSFDTKVLTEIWNRLDARQLEFQDFVFGQHCPDRLSVYEQVRLTVGTAPEDEVDLISVDPDDPSPSDLLESITNDDGPATKPEPSTTTKQRAGETTRSTTAPTTITTAATSTTPPSTNG